ncbi:MAG: NUDIX hydrolase [Candidatus Magasanikbacteria bacterium]|nr:NUDIX hydrolase [Candidatus Magasanikbacteria bacterium]
MKLPAGSFIASGPVIIENRRVLLNKELKKDGSISPWFFPGGEVEDFDLSLEETCAREAKEEMGIEIRGLKPLRTILLKNTEGFIILVHFLAERKGEIKPGPMITDWAWHPIDALPKDCASNVYTIIEDCKNMSDFAL